MNDFDIYKRVNNGESLAAVAESLRMTLRAAEGIYSRRRDVEKKISDTSNYGHKETRKEDGYWTLERKREVIDFYCTKGGQATVDREGWIGVRSAAAIISKFRVDIKYGRCSKARKPLRPEKWTRELVGELFGDWKEGKPYTFMCEKYGLKDRGSFEATKALLGKKHPDLRVTRNG